MNGGAVEKANTSATAVGYALFIVAPGLRTSATSASRSCAFGLRPREASFAAARLYRVGLPCLVMGALP